LFSPNDKGTLLFSRVDLRKQKEIYFIGCNYCRISIGTNGTKIIVENEASFCLKNSQAEKMD